MEEPLSSVVCVFGSSNFKDSVIQISCVSLQMPRLVQEPGCLMAGDVFTGSLLVSSD